MNIEFIKSEFEKLTLILRSWKEDHNISAIERDIVLDKLKNIYDAVRFADADADATATAVTTDSHPAGEAVAQPTENAVPQNATAATAAASSDPANKEDEQGDEVEVEFIFSDDDEQPQEASGMPAETDNSEKSAVDAENAATASEDAIVADLPAIPADGHRTLAVTSTMPSDVTVATDTTARTSEDSHTAPATSEERHAPVQTADATAKPEAEPAPATAAVHDTAEEYAPAADNSLDHTDTATEDHETDKHTVRRAMNSLFGGEEVKHRQPSRHHRMMSIYDYDTESKPEKVVDISKIFDNEDYAPDARYDASAYDSRDERPKHDDRTAANVSPRLNDTADEGVTTIADAMSGSKHTLADTLSRPAPLAEQITHSATTSLRDAIGINDKFLLIRDLFAGDDHEYEKAIAKLDSFDNLDDCLIYIAENYAWNPNSEGAKFMMQLLERKLS